MRLMGLMGAMGLDGMVEFRGDVGSEFFVQPRACLPTHSADTLSIPVPGDVHSLAIAPAVTRGKSGHHRAGFPSKGGALRLTRGDGECHRKSNRPSRAQARTARVKRRGKSPPRRPQCRRQDKPNPVQDQIGDQAARPMVPGKSHDAYARPPGSQESGGREMNERRECREAPVRTESGLWSLGTGYFSKKLEVRS